MIYNPTESIKPTFNPVQNTQVQEEVEELKYQIDQLNIDYKAADSQLQNNINAVTAQLNTFKQAVATNLQANNASLVQADIVRSNIVNSSFQGTIDNSDIVGSVFRDGELRNVTLDSTDLSVNSVHATNGFYGQVGSFVQLSVGDRVNSMKLADADIDRARMYTANITNSTIANSTLMNVVVDATDLHVNRLWVNEPTNITLHGSTISNSNITNSTFNTGTITNVDINAKNVIVDSLSSTKPIEGLQINGGDIKHAFLESVVIKNAALVNTQVSIDLNDKAFNNLTLTNSTGTFDNLNVANMVLSNIGIPVDSSSFLGYDSYGKIIAVKAPQTNGGGGGTVVLPVNARYISSDATGDAYAGMVATNLNSGNALVDANLLKSTVADINNLINNIPGGGGDTGAVDNLANYVNNSFNNYNNTFNDIANSFDVVNNTFNDVNNAIDDIVLNGGGTVFENNAIEFNNIFNYLTNHTSNNYSPNTIAFNTNLYSQDSYTYNAMVANIQHVVYSNTIPFTPNYQVPNVSIGGSYPNKGWLDPNTVIVDYSFDGAANAIYNTAETVQPVYVEPNFEGMEQFKDNIAVTPRDTTTTQYFGSFNMCNNLTNVTFLNVNNQKIVNGTFGPSNVILSPEFSTVTISTYSTMGAQIPFDQNITVQPGYASNTYRGAKFKNTVIHCDTVPDNVAVDSVGDSLTIIATNPSYSAGAYTNANIDTLTVDVPNATNIVLQHAQINHLNIPNGVLVSDNTFRDTSFDLSTIQYTLTTHINNAFRNSTFNDPVDVDELINNGTYFSNTFAELSNWNYPIIMSKDPYAANDAFSGCTNFNAPVTIGEQVNKGIVLFGWPPAGCPNFNRYITIENANIKNGYNFYVGTGFNLPITDDMYNMDMNYFMSSTTSFNQPVDFARVYDKNNSFPYRFLYNAYAFNQVVDLRNTNINSQALSWQWDVPNLNSPIYLRPEDTDVQLTGLQNFYSTLDIPGVLNTLMLSGVQSFNQPLDNVHRVNLAQCNGFNSTVTNCEYLELRRCAQYNLGIENINSVIVNSCDNFNQPITNIRDTITLYNCINFNQTIGTGCNYVYVQNCNNFNKELYANSEVDVDNSGHFNSSVYAPIVFLRNLDNYNALIPVNAKNFKIFNANNFNQPIEDDINWYNVCIQNCPNFNADIIMHRRLGSQGVYVNGAANFNANINVLNGDVSSFSLSSIINNCPNFNGNIILNDNIKSVTIYSSSYNRIPYGNGLINYSLTCNNFNSYIPYIPNTNFTVYSSSLVTNMYAIGTNDRTVDIFQAKEFKDDLYISGCGNFKYTVSPQYLNNIHNVNYFNSTGYLNLYMGSVNNKADIDNVQIHNVENVSLYVMNYNNVHINNISCINTNVAVLPAADTVSINTVQNLRNVAARYTLQMTNVGGAVLNINGVGGSGYYATKYLDTLVGVNISSNNLYLTSFIDFKDMYITSDTSYSQASCNINAENWTMSNCNNLFTSNTKPVHNFYFNIYAPPYSYYSMFNNSTAFMLGGNVVFNFANASVQTMLTNAFNFRDCGANHIEIILPVGANGNDIANCIQNGYAGLNNWMNITTITYL